MTTAANIINEALMLIGQLAEGEEPSAAGSQSALRRFKSMIETFNNDSLQIYEIQDEVFSLPANQQTRTIGSGGDFDTAWPIKILDSTFVRAAAVAPNVDFPVVVINNDQYSAITVKSITGPYPQYIYYDRAYPLGTLYFWPLATSTVDLHLSTWKPLTDLAGLTTPIVLPPGYEEMLTYNLAVRLAPSYGVEPLPGVLKVAAKTRTSLKRSNAQNEIMTIMPGLSAGAGWDYFSIYKGQPS